MSTHFASAVVRVHGETGEICGAGVVAEGFDGHYVLTCAHVLNKARRLDDYEPSRPTSLIFIDLPFAPGEKYRATVTEWYPAKPEGKLLEDPVADIAILRLEDKASEYIRAERFNSGAAVPGRRFLTYGFPPEADTGLDAGGELRYPTAGGWLRIIDPIVVGRFVEGGFSGAPVFTDDALHDVLGIVVAAEYPTTKQAYVIPTKILQLAWPPLARPYQALRAFDESTAWYFFGRRTETQTLVERVQRHPLVPVFGASGSGKSSLVLAGLIPQLRHKGGWLIARFQPRSSPLHALVRDGLAPLFGSGRTNPVERLQVVKGWVDSLRERPRIEDIARTILEEAHGGDKILLVVDQFEQVFLQSLDATERETRVKFLEVLRTAPPDLVRVVVTLRAGFVGAAAEYAFLANALQDAAVVVGPLTEAGLREAVEEPARRLHVSFEGGGQNGSTSLVERLVAAVFGREGGLPLLQFALAELWRRQIARPEGRILSHEAYDAIGGVEGALRVYAERIFDELDETEKGAVLRILPRLARAGEGAEQVRTTLRRSEVGEADWAVAGKLIAARLVTADRDPVNGEETVEVAHEVIFRAWPRLGDLVSEDPAFALWRPRLAYALRVWRDSGRDDSALLRGALLHEAQSWIGRRRSDLTADELRFIDTSAAESTRAQREREAELRQQAETEARLRKEAEERAEEAEHQRQVATARQLAAQSQLILQSDAPELTERGLLLGVEALKRCLQLGISTFEADQAVRRGLAIAARHCAQMTAEKDVDLRAVSLHPQEPIVAYGQKDGQLFRWDFLSGTHRAFGLGLQSSVSCVEFSHNGKWLAAGDDAGNACLVDVATETLRLLDRPDGAGPVRSICFDQDDSSLAVAFGATVAVWSLASLNECVVLANPDSADTLVISMTFHQGGTVLITQALMAETLMWRWKSKDIIGRNQSGGNFVTHSPDGRFLGISSSTNYTAHLFDILKQEWHLLANNAAKLAFSGDGRYVAIASPESVARIWKLPALELLHTLRHNNELWDLDFSPDGSKLMTKAKNDVLRIWDIESGDEVTRILPPQLSCWGRFLFDSRYVVSFSAPGVFVLWDTQNLREKLLLPYRVAVLEVAFSPDLPLLATGARERLGVVTPVLIDLRNQQPVAKLRISPDLEIDGSDYARELLKKHKAASRNEAKSPDGSIIARADDVSVHIYTAESDVEPRFVLRHEHRVETMVFSFDGRHLLTSSDRDTARIWDISTGQEISRLTHDTPTITDADFDPSGRYVATSSWDCTARVWIWRPEDLLEETASRLRRDLSAEEWERYLPGEAPGSIHEANTGGDLPKADSQ